ncbi:MAG: DUF1707 SHOCT-like domain-containing protein [Trebonia sp.]
MSHMHNEPGAPAVRASDVERDEAAEVLRAAFAEGRLTRPELDERLDAAYAARTRADLAGLTGDLPGGVPEAVTAHDRPPAVDHGPGTHLNLCLLLCLLCAFPPAGIAYAIYWIVTARRQPQPPAGEPFLSPGA